MRTKVKHALFITLSGTFMLAACQKTSFEERVEKEVSEFNQRDAGRRIDEYTIMDSMSFDASTLTLGYHYTLEGEADDSTLITGELRQKNRESLLGNIRGSIAMREYKEQGCTFLYVYSSRRTGMVMMKEEISPKDYR